VADPSCWRQLRYSHFVCESHAGSWRLDACCSPLGDGRADPELWGLLQSSHVLRESQICACRGLDACCAPFGKCRMAPSAGLILQGCHAPCDNQPFATNVRTSLPREAGTDVAHDASVRSRPPSGGVIQVLRPTPAAPQFSSGRRSAMAEYTPACGSHLSREVRIPCCAVTAHPSGRKARPRSCQATATSHAECGTVPSGVSDPPLQLRCGGRRVKGPGPHEVSSADSILSARKGGRNPLCAGCLQLRCRLAQPFIPADNSLVYGVPASCG
jgi:hypothetical protein